LTAELTIQRPAEVGGHFRRDPTVDETQLVLTLHFIANAHTHAALDAEIHVEADEVGFVVNVKLPGFDRERQLNDFIFMDQLLQPAIAGCVTGRAQKRMGPQEQHQLHPTILCKRRRLGNHLHAFPCRVETRGHSAFSAPRYHLHHAQTAGAVWDEAFVVT
jgi:hypothetical protein